MAVLSIVADDVKTPSDVPPVTHAPKKTKMRSTQKKGTRVPKYSTRKLNPKLGAEREKKKKQVASKKAKKAKGLKSSCLKRSSPFASSSPKPKRPKRTVQPKIKAPWELDRLEVQMADEKSKQIDYPCDTSLRPKPYFSEPNLINKMEMQIKV